MKRVFLIVLDSVGIGEMPDAGQYGDKGSNTLASSRYRMWNSWDTSAKNTGFF